MLRGNYTTRIDDKGRLKIPAHFRRKIEEKYGSEIYVTSLTGQSVQIFPLKEWEIIEQKIALLPTNESTQGHTKGLDSALFPHQVGLLALEI